jgi:signal transduction histidine kinase
MKQDSDASEEMMQLLDRYAAGRIPPLIDMESPEAGLIDRRLFEIYQIGFRHRFSGVLGVRLASDQPGSLKDKWKSAANLSLETTEQAWTGFCAALRDKASGDEACIACNRYWAWRAEEEGRAIAYLCTHGLIDLAVPIIVHDTTISVVFSGQLFPKPGIAWNPELVEPGGLLRPLASGEKGVDAWEESLKRIRQAEQQLGFADGELLDALKCDVEKEATPQDVVNTLGELSLLGKQLSQLAAAKLESEKSKIRTWIGSGISSALAQLEAEASTDLTTKGFKGIVRASVTKMWKHVARYLEYTCHYFGFAYLLVLSCDYSDNGGTLTVLSHWGQWLEDFPFSKQYDCTESHASLQALSSEMIAWRTATEVDLERYARLPVIEPLYKSLRRHRPLPTYAVSGQFVRGISPVLILGSLDYRKRTTPLSGQDLREFTEIGEEIGLVANICTLVAELDEATDRQARFIENVAHDIRNPIQNLISMANFMQIESLSIEDKQGMAREIASEVRRTNELSQRVWVLEGLRRGMFDLGERHWVNIFDVIMRCRKSLQHSAVQNNIEFKVEEEIREWPNAQINEELFYHTILNLMDNAVKYSAPNTEVLIDGKLRAREYELTFGNIGLGIPEDERERIFQRHYRAKNAQRKIREGTGIGLSIVKAFADYYGGIEVVSYPLEGSSRHHTLFRLIIRRE